MNKNKSIICLASCLAQKSTKFLTTRIHTVISSSDSSADRLGPTRVQMGRARWKREVHRVLGVTVCTCMSYSYVYQHLQRGHQWKPPHYLGISIGHPLETLGNICSIRMRHMYSSRRLTTQDGTQNTRTNSRTLSRSAPMLERVQETVCNVCMRKV